MTNQEDQQQERYSGFFPTVHHRDIYIAEMFKSDVPYYVSAARLGGLMLLTGKRDSGISEAIMALVFASEPSEHTYRERHLASLIFLCARENISALPGLIAQMMLLGMDTEEGREGFVEAFIETEGDSIENAKKCGYDNPLQDMGLEEEGEK